MSGGSWNPFDAIREAINDATDWIEERVEDVRDDIKEFSEDLIESVEEISSKVWEELDRINDQLVEEAKKQLADLEDGIKDLGKNFDDWVTQNIVAFCETHIDAALNSLENLRNLTKNLGSAVLEGDLNAIEDSLKEAGRTFEDDYKEYLKAEEDRLKEIGRDFDDALHAAVDPFVDAIQEVRDEYIRPAWNTMREAFNDALETVEDDVLKPMLEETIAAIDEVASKTLPDEFDAAYKDAKDKIEDTVNYIQEKRDDISDELKEWEDELKKAGKFIDDAKEEIIKMAAVIAVGIVAGPAAAAALQLALDELSGKESLFDRALDGNIEDIAEILTIVAQFLPVVGPAIGISTQTMAVIKNAQTILKVTSQLLQQKDQIESIIKGEFDNIEEILLKTAISYGSSYLSQSLPQDVGSIIADEDFLFTLATGNSDEIKDEFLGNVVEKVGGYLDESFNIPDELFESVVEGNVDDYVKENLQGIISSEISSMINQSILNDFAGFMDEEAISRILEGDFSSIEDELKEKIGESLNGFIDENLPAAISNIVNSEDVKNLIDGDFGVLEDKLKDLVKTELEIYEEMIKNNEIVSSINEFKDNIENTIDDINNLKDEVKDQYEEIADSYQEQFNEIKDQFKNELKEKIDNAKNLVKNEIILIQTQLEEISQSVVGEVKTQIDTAITQAQELIDNEVDYLTSEVKNSIEEIKSQVNSVKDEVEESYQEVITNVENTIEGVKSQIEDGIKVVDEYVSYVEDEVNLNIEETQKRFEEIAGNLNQEFHSRINEIKTLGETLVNDAKDQFLSYKDQIDQISNNILQNVNQYKDIIAEFSDNMELAVKDYVTEQKVIIKSAIDSIKNDTETTINQAQEEILDEVDKNINELENITDELSSEYQQTLKLLKSNIDEFVEISQNISEEILNDLSKSIDDAISYFENAKLNLEINARIILTEIIAPELKEYLNEVESIFNDLENSYEEKKQLLEAIKDKNIEEINTILTELEVESQEVVSNALSIVEEAYNIYDKVNEKIKLAKDLANESIDILGQEYKDLIDQFNNIIIQDLVDGFKEKYQDISLIFELEFINLQQDLDTFISNMESSINEVEELATDINETFSQKLEEYENIVQENVALVKEAIESHVDLLNESILESKNSALNEVDKILNDLADTSDGLQNFFQDQITDISDNINELVEADYSDLLNVEFLTNLVRNSQDTIEETIVGLANDIDNSAIVIKSQEITHNVVLLQQSIEQKFNEIQDFNNQVQTIVTSSADILNELNQSQEIITQGYYDLLKSYENSIEKLEGELSNEITRFIDEQLINNYQSAISEANDNISNITLNIQDSIKNAITTQVIQNISGSFNHDYIEGIITDKISELTNSYFNEDAFISELITTEIVEEAANWFRDTVNVISGNGNNNTINGTSGRDYVVDSRGNDNINTGDGDDYVQSGDGNDIIEAGGGNDSIRGGRGNDYYVFNKGDGSDYVVDAEGDGNGYRDQADVLRINGYNADDIILTKVGYNNYDLEITFKSGSDDKIYVAGQFHFASNHTVEFLELDDGTRFQLKNINISIYDDSSNTIYGTDVSSNIIDAKGGDDIVYGGVLSDIIEGGKGADILKGGMGNDTYVFSKGDGKDIISDAEGDPNGHRNVADKLQINGYTNDQLIFTKDGYNLVISFKDNSEDKITIAGQFHWAVNHRVELLEIVDSNVNLNLKDVTILHGSNSNETIHGIDWTSNTIYGFEGDDYIYGKGHDDVINGGLGADILKGGMGNDTYVFSKGDGKDIISDAEGNKNGHSNVTDKLQINGYTNDQLIFTKDGYNLVITFKDNSEDKITIAAHFHWAFNHRIELLEVVDSNVNLNLKDVTILHGSNSNETIHGIDWTSNTIYGFEGDDYIYGKGHDDVINGGLGDDILNGGLGSDSFNYSSILDSTESGMDVIEDFEQGIDKINLSEIEDDISFEDLLFELENGETTISHNGSEFAIKLQGEIEFNEGDFNF